jgi:hypothetical protein
MDNRDVFSGTVAPGSALTPSIATNGLPTIECVLRRQVSAIPVTVILTRLVFDFVNSVLGARGDYCASRTNVWLSTKASLA